MEFDIFTYIVRTTYTFVWVVLLSLVCHDIAHSQSITIDCNTIDTNTYLYVIEDPFNTVRVTCGYKAKVYKIHSDTINLDTILCHPDLFYGVVISYKYLPRSFNYDSNDTLDINCGDMNFNPDLFTGTTELSKFYTSRYKNKWYWLWPYTSPYISRRKIKRDVKNGSFDKLFGNYDPDSSINQKISIVSNYDKLYLLDHLLDELSYDDILDYLFDQSFIEDIDLDDPYNLLFRKSYATRYQEEFIKLLSTNLIGERISSFMKTTFNYNGYKKKIHHFMVISTLYRLEKEFGILSGNNWKLYGIDYNEVLKYLNRFKEDPKTNWLIRYLKVNESKSFDFDHEIVGIDREVLNLSKLIDESKEEIIILDFWATWCRPCIRSFGDLVELGKEGNLKVISLSVDDTFKKFDTWVKKNNTIYPLDFYISEKEDDSISRAFSIRALPTYLVFDKRDKSFYGPMHSIDQIKTTINLIEKK